MTEAPDADWAVWQVPYFARVDGVEGRVDLDVTVSSNVINTQTAGVRNGAAL